MANPINLNQYPRELTDGEFNWYLKAFPNLVKNTITVLGPKDTKYNCISYSLGFTDRWIDVGFTKEGLATMYAHYFYEGCATAQGTIDVYADESVPKHAAKVESTTTCSSKMQIQSTLRHPRQALEGKSRNGYGYIYGHFMKNAAHPGNDHPTIPGPDHPNNHELPTPLPVGHPEGGTPIPVVKPQPSTALHPHAAGPAPGTSPAPSGAVPAPHATAPDPHTGHPAPSAPHVTAPNTNAPHATAPPTTAPHTTAPHATLPQTTAPHSSPPQHPTGRGRPGHFGVTRMAVKPMAPYSPVPPPADEAVATANQLHESLKNSYGPAVSNFENLFDSWKATWNTPEMELEPNSSARATGPAYDALVKLGPAIIPLVVKKLADPTNFFAIHLYNALEQDEEAKVDPANLLDHNVVQRHANLIVDINHARATAFSANANAWAQHQDDNSLSANSATYVSGDAYQSLVSMGPSVIGHALEKYAKEPSGWWHELLHEIVHGYKAGPGTFFKDRLKRDWKDWFEMGLPNEAAPRMRSAPSESS